MIAGNKNPKDNILLANFHTHTFRCHHAVGQDREYVEKAIEQGIKTLGFSDHSPYFFDGDYYSHFRMRPEEFDGYVNSLLALRDEYKDDIDIFKMAFQILNIRLHQLGLTGSTNARDDLDVRSTIQFNDSVEILCSCNCFHIVTRFQKSKIFIFLKLLRCIYYTVCL